jgi:RNA polymerase sigma factor (sigma-70 family)
MDSLPLKRSRTGLLAGRSPLLRLQSDDRLILLIRAGNEGAFELLFERYRPRLLSFCRHMLGSKEDAEDVLQDLFVAAYNAIRADERELNVRPWLYRIARNRCLNHLRRPVQDGRDTMDDQVHAHGISVADIVHKRADFRHLLADIQKLPETQRTALLLREIDVLSYEQIAEAMETTVPSVKSLLVRARMSLAEAAEARKLTCNDVRRELAEVVEGLKKTTPPIRRHLRDCEQCARYRSELRRTNTAMAMMFPVGAVLLFKKLVLAKLGAAALSGGATAGGGAAATGGASATAASAGAAAAGGASAGAAAAGGAAAGGLAAGGLGTAAGGAGFGLSAVASKAIAVTAATALVAGGAVEVKRIATPQPTARPAAVQTIPPRTGGQSASALPPVPLVKEKLQAAEAGVGTPADGEPKPATDPTAGEEATIPAPTDGAETPLATSPPPPVGSGEEIEPADGTGQGATGGVTVPQPSGQSDPEVGAKTQPGADGQTQPGAGQTQPGAGGQTQPAPGGQVPSE